MRRELNDVIREEMAVFKNKIDCIERQCEQARDAALAPWRSAIPRCGCTERSRAL